MTHTLETVLLVLRTKQPPPSCLPLINRHQEASITPGKIVSSPLESVVLVELLAQSAICFRVVADNVEETVGICEHGLQVVAEVGIARADPPKLGSSGRVEPVEEGAVGAGDVEFTLVDKVRDGSVENVRYTRGAKEPRIAFTGADTIVNILDVSSNTNTPESLVLRIVRWLSLIDGMQILHLVNKHLSTSKHLVGPRGVQVTVTTMNGAKHYATV